MKKSKFTEAQIAFVLKQAEDGTPVAEVCRKAGVAEATFYNWRKRYAGLMPSEVKRSIAALVGLPAGRLVDTFGSSKVMVSGLISVTIGTASMMALPGWFGTSGYVGGLVLMTAGYALFQAANSTAVMVGISNDQKGVTSALLGLSRNLGLITGASAMGLVFGLGRQGILPLGLAPGSGSGLQLTFTLAAALALGALSITLWSQRAPA